jgi:hypothetical protein
MTGIRPNSGRPILIPVNPLPNAALGAGRLILPRTQGRCRIRRMPRWHSPAEEPGVAPGTVLPELRQRAWSLANQDRISKHYFAPVSGSEIPQIRAGIPGASNWSGAGRATRLPGAAPRRAGAGNGSAVRTRFLTDRFAAYKARRQQVTATRGGRDESLSRRQQHSGRKAPERGTTRTSLRELRGAPVPWTAARPAAAPRPAVRHLPAAAQQQPGRSRLPRTAGSVDAEAR